MSQDPTDVSVKPAKKSVFSGLSLIWIIPVLALVATLSVAWKNYNDRGPLITIEFANGAGIGARETELRYRDITVGKVESVKFSEGLASVIVAVRIDKEVAAYVDASSSFWVVRPELTARGVSGLDTVLSGVFIEGSWDNQVGAEKTAFRGLEDAPLFKADEKGLQIVMRTTADGTITDNSPILFRGIEVGKVGRARISPQGNFAIAEAIIYEPHDRLITPSTRFWDTSGVDFKFGPQGAEVNFASVATLLGGGFTFDTFVSGGDRVPDGTVFEVYATKATARESVFNASQVDPLEVSVVFNDNISGLAVGAGVELSGLRIGEVSNVTGIIDRDAFGDSRVRLNAVLKIQPRRLGLPGEVTPEAALNFLTEQVRVSGLRARLASGSLLTGGLKIELVELPDAPEVGIRTGKDGVPILPATESQISDAAATVEGVMNRVNNLPIEQLLNSAIDFMDSAEALVSDPNLRETPTEVLGLLGDVRGIVSSDGVQQIPVSLSAALTRVENILGQLEQEQAVAKMVAAIESAGVAAEGVNSSIIGIPALIEQINALAAKAEELPLTELTAQVTELVNAAEGILDTPGARDLPASLSAALEQVTGTLRDLREGEAVTNVNATLASARQAADAVATSTGDLPGLVNRFSRVLDQATATIQGYNQGDVISRDAQLALRELTKAADAVTSLARMLERNPSALIRGR